MLKRVVAAIAAACVVVVPRAGWAQDSAPPHDMSQHDMPGMDMSGMETQAAAARPLDLPEERQGSGTSWLPDESSMNAVMRRVGGWMVMTHGQLFLQYIDVSGPRGDHQAGSINWLMVAASRSIPGGRGGELAARVMVSAEALTVGRCGYPDLTQSGESCRGAALHDRQHPHDLFMEVAAIYRRAVGSDVAIELYGGPVGEPALGPVAFPHRASALLNPIAPISHHWLDATHISFGVATAGVYGRRWKAEVSAFNGREPDDGRYGVDVAALDWYATRLSWLPSRRWALQVSTGRLHDAEEHDGESVDVQRTSASVMYHRVAGPRTWATTAAWGRNVEEGRAAQAALLETSASVTLRDTLFGRVEVVRKSARDLVVAGDSHAMFTIGKWQAGYVRQVFSRNGVDAGIGASVGLAVLPTTLQIAYASGRPVEGSVFFTLRPAARVAH